MPTLCVNSSGLVKALLIYPALKQYLRLFYWRKSRGAKSILSSTWVWHFEYRSTSLTILSFVWISISVCWFRRDLDTTIRERASFRYVGVNWRCNCISRKTTQSYRNVRISDVRKYGCKITRNPKQLEKSRISATPSIWDRKVTQDLDSQTIYNCESKINWRRRRRVDRELICTRRYLY